mmetsp:Transcript_10220/g.18359  ORF Transcript_10220/g.18359 Transcript_10220/m.18359 type:complete len:146 (+) Transcript_10220:403-840(+)|eukprot:CAMPEP_0201628436 /NCGR_PEP_ID=MMETSP0493-20130528/3385_1 /ASSEMBLY_ACC=CAM_ASM_000838 /TAXON_ID=420259 /ORGANISM="Thalassiosira gravida, Strain GMp14c1" /LENGTH=145 /DNA_ID=CAMNT_0048099195 /DNA_START=388 /DNA_END=825 /DNA_ORIENTATION=-
MINAVPHPRRSIPASVEFSKIEHQLPMEVQSSRPSQPIPIKNCRRPVSPELQEDASSADTDNSSQHWESSTWRMYERITTARRIRAFSRIGHSVTTKQQSLIMQDLRDIGIEIDVDHNQINHQVEIQPSTSEEFGDDEVFAFDDM